jgi:hypothetical protein
VGEANLENKLKKTPLFTITENRQDAIIEELMANLKMRNKQNAHARREVC